MFKLIDKGILLHGIKNEWRPILDNEQLDKIINSRQIDPTTLSILPENIFEFAKLTDYEKFHVVILGQDPYIKLHEPHGLSFSSLIHVPPSLKNVYKCLVKQKLMDKMPATGNLTSWAKQGVLLLNCALTTQVGISNAHKNIWKSYTDTLISDISRLSNEKRPIIFVLWGNYAHKKESLISKNKHTYVLKYSHPSPLQQKEPFEDCANFTEVNKILGEYNLPIINWDPYITLYKEPSTNWSSGEFTKNIIDKLSINDRTLIAFTDGSCEPNISCPESRAGYACSFEANEHFSGVIIYGSLDVKEYYATSVRAEGYAIMQVLNYALNKTEFIDTWDRLIIMTDCDLWKKLITEYIPLWKRKSMSFTDKENSDLTSGIDRLMRELVDNKSKTVDIVHVRSAHKLLKKETANYQAGAYDKFCYDNNDYVDKLANYARLKVEPGKMIIGTAELDK